MTTTMNVTDLTYRAGVLGAALDTWAARPAEGADLEHIQAARTAIETIDTMLADLHEVRSRLVTENRADEDVRNARIDAMLDARRGSHPFVRPGQVAADLPAPDACVSCGQPGAAHCGAAR